MPNKYSRELVKPILKSCECGCGEVIADINKMGRVARFKHGHNRKWKRGDNHPFWKGGRMKSLGYWRIWKPDDRLSDSKGYVLEHRLIWEKFHKACLLPWGIVHHIDENRENNNITNLQGMMKSKHTSYHNIKLGKIPPYIKKP